MYSRAEGQAAVAGGQWRHEQRRVGVDALQARDGVPQLEHEPTRGLT